MNWTLPRVSVVTRTLDKWSTTLPKVKGTIFLESRSYKTSTLLLTRQFFLTLNLLHGMVVVALLNNCRCWCLVDSKLQQWSELKALISSMVGVGAVTRIGGGGREYGATADEGGGIATV